MTLADETITQYLSHLLGNSSPGDIMHHLLVAAAEPGHRSALGLVEPDKLELTIYAIAPDDTVNAMHFISQAIAKAAFEARKDRRIIHFAGLSIEVFGLELTGDDEAAENRARRLHADGKLPEHPSAVEQTRLYAACSDGRRWIGKHFLTGPQAGTIIGPDLRVGGLANDEREPHHRLVRSLVMGR